MQKEEIKNALILFVKEDKKSELEAYRRLMEIMGIGDIIETLQNLEKKNEERNG